MITSIDKFLSIKEVEVKYSIKGQAYPRILEINIIF